MSAQGQAAAGARTRVTGRALTGWLGQHPLFLEIQQRPVLLLEEIAWRWCCGSLLLLLAGFAAWRVWTASLPALQATGLLLLTPDSLPDTLLTAPAQLLTTLLAGFDVLRPPLERTAAGLIPLAVFVWVCAFAWGRTRVLAQFDPRLPRRPWLLAELETLRIGGLLAITSIWASLAHIAYAFAFQKEDTHILLYGAALLAITLATSWLTGRFNRAIVIAAALALVEGRSLLPSVRRGWRMDKHTRIVPLRKAVGQIRAYLLIAAVVLAFVPAPFHFGWALVAWWLLFSLPPLVAADAWRLGAFFGLLRAFEVCDPAAGTKAKP